MVLPPSARRTALALFAFVLALYLLTASGHVFTVDGYSRLELSRSLLKGEPWVGHGLPLEGGRSVAHWLPMQSLLGVPLVMAARGAASLSSRAPAALLESALFSGLNQLLGALASVGIFALLFALGHRRRAALLTALAFALCTYVWPTAKDSYEAPITLVFLIFYCLALALPGEPGPRRMAAATLLLTALLFTRITNALMVPGLAALAVLAPLGERRPPRFRRLGWVIGAGVLAGMLNLAYNQFRFGDPLDFGNSHYVTGGKTVQGLGELFSTPLWLGLFSNALSPCRGLVWYSPLLVLSLASAVPWARRFPAFAIGLAAAVVPEALSYCKWLCWDGGWCWGPRFMFNLHLLLFLPLAEWLEAPRDRPRVTVPVRLLVAVALLSQLLAVSVCYHRAYYRRMATGRPTFTLWWCPLLEQAEDLVHVAGVVAGDRSALVVSPPRDLPPARLLDVDAKLNLPDFWWVYACHQGIPRPLVLALLLGLAAVALGAGLALRRSLVAEDPAGA